MQKYGWKPSKPDIRDFKFSSVVHAAPLPKFVDLRGGFSACYDQEELGSCTANALAAKVEFLLRKERKPVFMPSRLFIYYNERLIEGTVNYDSGATIRDGMKVLNRYGSPNENLWWYNIKKFTIKPNAGVYADALNHRTTSYYSINNQNLYDLRNCLAQGYPFVFGFTVYDSFESQDVAKTGMVPMPKLDESVLGGHAVVGVGYDDAKSHFIVRNSWGHNWGEKGYCFMPYQYLTNPNLATDFWTARFVN